MAGRDSSGLSDSQRNAGDEYFELCCTLCSTLNKEAVKYCLTCTEYCCIKCVESHKNFKMLSRHVLVHPRSTNTLSNSFKPIFHDVPTELCKKHPQEVVNMYCVDDDTVGCAECFELDHKTCEDINYVPKHVLSEFPSEQQVQQINQDLRRAIIVSNRLIAQHRSLSNNLEKNKDICRTEIQKYREEINHTIDKLEAATLAELDARHEMIKQKTDDMKRHIQDLHDEMVRLKSEMESDHSNNSQKFVITKLSQCKISQSQELTPKLLCDQTKGLTFSRNTDIMTFLLSIDTLGMRNPPEMQKTILSTTKPQIKPSITQQQLTDKPESRDKPIRKVPTNSKHPSNTKVATSPQKQVVYKVKDSSQYSIKELRDANKCHVCSICILENGDILLADQSNCKIKLVESSTYQLRASRKLDAKPWSVNKGRGSENAAVCLHNDTILFVSPHTLDKERSLNVKHKCRVTTFIRNRTYVSDYKTIYIYALHGKLIKTIDKGKSGNYIFSYINDIAVSDDEKMIHVADRCLGVITLNADGNVMRRFSGTPSSELRGANGVCTDGSGNVIVCGNMTHNVIQLGPDGKYVGEIVPYEHHMRHPLTVCYDRNNHKLIVGNSEDNTILVFTVQ